MRVKILVILLCVVFVVAGSFAINFLGNTSAKTENPTQSISETKTQSQPITNNPTNPDTIPDRLAFTILFRFLANPMNSPDENVRRQSKLYLKQARLGRRNCNSCSAEPTDEADVNVLFAAATEFQERVDVLDRQAVQLKRQNRTNPNPAITAQLTMLQQQKEAIVDNIVASLPARLSNHAKQELQRFIRENIKPNIQRN